MTLWLASCPGLARVAMGGVQGLPRADRGGIFRPQNMPVARLVGPGVGRDRYTCQVTPMVVTVERPRAARSTCAG